MKKRILIILCFLCVMLPTKVHAESEGEDELPKNDVTEEEDKDEMMDQLSLEEINTFWLQFRDEYGAFFTKVPTKNLSDMIKDEGSISIKSIVKGLVQFLFYEITTQAKLLGSLLMLTLFSIILQAISSAFEKKDRKSTRLNSSHVAISYAVFCL